MLAVTTYEIASGVSLDHVFDRDMVIK